MIESEADSMMISTDKWLLSEQERASLRAANARLVVEKNALYAMAERWQSILGAARGNISKAEKEVRDFLNGML